MYKRGCIKVILVVLFVCGLTGVMLIYLGGDRLPSFPEQTHFYERYHCRGFVAPVHLIPVPGFEGCFEAVDVVFSKCRFGKSGLVVKMLDSDVELLIEAGEPIIVMSFLLPEQVLVLGILDEVRSCRGEAVVRWFEESVLVDIRGLAEPLRQRLFAATEETL